jgi:hypothetical protein
VKTVTIIENAGELLNAVASYKAKLQFHPDGRVTASVGEDIRIETDNGMPITCCELLRAALAVGNYPADWEVK